MPLTLLRMFGGLEETHEAMREVFKSDFGLDPSGNIELRKEIAILPSVWESSRMQLKCQESRSESSRFQAWSTTAPRPELGKSGYAGCCVEAAQGRSLKDREIPSKIPDCGKAGADRGWGTYRGGFARSDISGRCACGGVWGSH